MLLWLLRLLLLVVLLLRSTLAVAALHMGNLPLQYVMDALFFIPPDRSFVRSFVSSFQVNEAATERDIFQFVMRSYRSFELVLYQRLVGCRPTNCGRGGDGKPSSDFASADPVGADLLSGSRPHFFASLMREGAGSYSSGMLDMMAMMTRDHSCQFQAIEHAANR